MIVAQRNPLLVIVLKREDPAVGTVGVRKEFSQRVDILERAGVQGVESPTLVNGAY